MDVIGIGQGQAGLDLGLIALKGGGKGGPGQRRFDPGEGLRLRADLGGGQHPFAQDPVRPDRLIQPLSRQPQKNLPQDGGVQHAGIQDHPHGAP